MKVKNVFTYFTDTILRRNEDSYRNPRVRWAVRQYKLLFYTARGLIAHDTVSYTHLTLPTTPYV